MRSIWDLHGPARTNSIRMWRLDNIPEHQDLAVARTSRVARIDDSPLALADLATWRFGAPSIDAMNSFQGAQGS